MKRKGESKVIRVASVGTSSVHTDRQTRKPKAATRSKKPPAGEDSEPKSKPAARPKKVKTAAGVAEKAEIKAMPKRVPHPRARKSMIIFSDDDYESEEAESRAPVSVPSHSRR